MTNMMRDRGEEVSNLKRMVGMLRCLQRNSFNAALSLAAGHVLLLLLVASALVAVTTSRGNGEEVGVQVKPVSEREARQRARQEHHRGRRELCTGWQVRRASPRRKRLRLCARGCDPIRKLRDRTGQSL